MSWLKQMKGDAYIGYRAIVVHPLKKLVSQDGRTGKQRFLDNYATEGLVPTGDEDQHALLAASRCINCGLCDFHDLVLGTVPRHQYSGMSLFPVAYTRWTSDLARLSKAVHEVTDDALAAGEAVCPTRVPLRILAAYVRRKTGEVAKAMSP
jgi:hypothetical protein